MATLWSDPSAGRGKPLPYGVALILLWITTLTWAGLALNYAPTLVRAFQNRGIPHARLWIGGGFALWLGAGLPSMVRLHRLLPRQTSPGFLLVSVAAFLTAIVTWWLQVFDVPQFLISLLALHLVLPVVLMVVSLSLSASSRGHSQRSMRPLASTWASLVGGLALALASALLVSGMTELLFRRFSGVPPELTDEYGTRFDFVLSPYVMFAEPTVAEGGRTNRQGFFGPELVVPKPAGELRIAMLGGSVVWAGKDYASIATHLERKLRERASGRSLRVVNFGRQSYVSMQELILLQRNVLPLDVDVVIVFDGFNDMGVPYRSEPLGVGYPFLFSSLKRLTEMTVGQAALHHLVRDLRSHSAAVTFATEKLALRRKAVQHAAYDIGAVCAEYERNLYQMGVLAREYGARVLIATQPFVGTKPSRTEREDGYYPAEERERLRGYYARMITAAARAAARSGAQYADTTNIFDAVKDEIFEDATHFAMHGGNPIAAERLAGELISRGLVP